MRKTSRVITNVLEDCQKKTLKLVREELVHKSVVEMEGYSAKDTTVHSYTEIGTLLERQEENLEIYDCIFSNDGRIHPVRTCRISLGSHSAW